jgi:hypothetical protein
MRAELLSTSRPTTLRLVGFALAAVGALAAGMGALLPWVSVGFTADVRHLVDVSIAGVDVWDGIVVLIAALAALILVLSMRVSRSFVARQAMAGVIGLAGLSIAIVVGLDIASAERRFGAADVRSSVVDGVSRRIGQPSDVVRPLLERALAEGLRVQLRFGLVLSFVGGLALILAGVLGARWARSDRAADAVADPPDGAAVGIEDGQV